MWIRTDKRLVNLAQVQYVEISGDPEKGIISLKFRLASGDTYFVDFKDEKVARALFEKFAEYVSASFFFEPEEGSK